MTIYVKIPILANNPIYAPEDFAADFLVTTGVVYNLDVMKEEAGVNQMLGFDESAITEAQVIELKSRWPMTKYYIGFPSSDQWSPELEPIE